MDAPGTEVTYQTTFVPSGDGGEVWAPFSKDGRLANDGLSWVSSGEPLAGAIAVRFTLKPGEKRTVPMVIAWDLPVVEFGSGRKWHRRYTEFFGTSGANVWRIAGEALGSAAAWSDAIDAWQAPYVNDASKPLWYRGQLFNELYILADGGSVWARPVDSTPEAAYTFGFLECFDYPYYATLDVRFYGSMPLLKFWPDIDKQVLRQFAETVPKEVADKQLWIWKSFQTRKNEFRLRKAKGAVPHDLGVPTEDPFVQVNQFSWQNTNDWKDLNPKFVLMIYRDFVFTGRKDVAFLRETWPAVVEALDHLKQYDHDGDGLPENDGYPDQTYDEWVVRGESAYCGGLFLAAVRAAEEIARVLGDAPAADRYHALFARSQASYVKKLWNGEYFRYDTASEYRDNVQADQLAGQWYAHMTGLGDIVPARHAGQGPEEDLRHQRHEVRQGRDGRGERAHGRRHAGHDQLTGRGGVDGHHLRPRGPHAGRRHEGRGLPDGLGRLPRHVRDEGLLVPDARGLGRDRPLPRLDVHAPRRDLGYGDDAPARRALAARRSQSFG